MSIQELAGTPRAAEYFVENQKDSMTAADFAYPLKIGRQWNGAAGGESADWFHRKSQHGIRT